VHAPGRGRVPSGRALREWQVDQAAEREVAGSCWGTGLVFTTATGTPLGARHILRVVPGRLREGRARPGLGASGSAAHVRLAAVRRWHGDRKDCTACWPCQQPLSPRPYTGKSSGRSSRRAPRLGFELFELATSHRFSLHVRSPEARDRLSPHREWAGGGISRWRGDYGSWSKAADGAPT
jgi:hypothetical protein